MAYGTDEGFATWLASQGLTLPVGAPLPAVLRAIGSSYVDSAYGWKLACSQKTGGFSQELEWPRVNHTVNGELVPDDLIPPAWINASYRAGYLTAVTPGWATTGTDGSRQTKREKVDVVEREFFAASEAAGSDVAPGMPSDSIINGMVAMWLCSNKRTANSLFRVI
jgi:hypothetical protein